MRAVEEGHRATAFFVIQMADVLDFAPNDTTHPAFGEALREAARRGVEVAAYTCRVTPETVTLDAPCRCGCNRVCHPAAAAMCIYNVSGKDDAL